MLNIGIYEQIINRIFKRKLDILDKEKFHVGEQIMPKEMAAEYLSRYLMNFIHATIVNNTLIEDTDTKIRMVNDVIKYIGRSFNIDEAEDNLIAEGGRLLTAVLDRTRCDYPDIDEYIKEITPETKLSSCELFTGRQRNDGLTMESELKKEICSADCICMLVAFIKQSGLNLLYDSLKRFTDRGGKLKVITTTYTRASESKAIKKIALLKNTEVKISYDQSNDRLHAKSYLFVRKTGFDTAYVGSSNMSRDALKQGLEWNIKATAVELPHIIRTVKKTFNAYWLDECFETYTPGIDDARLQYALDETPYKPIDYSLFDLIKAKDYQNEVLDRLTIEREVHGRFHNLIVAATGTGKTVISAFDFKRFKEEHKDKCHLLFVAHREEILRQAIDTFRYVLRDENFGELWYSGQEPAQYNDIFASKDTLYSRLTNGKWSLPADYYDYIIIDEAHHISADSYQPIINHFKPTILLGLTATPERSDFKDITRYFDGTISANIRLTDALNNKLLAPFHYYGVTDCVDLNTIKWHNGQYDVNELTKIYTENSRRTSIILQALEKYLNDCHKVKALCFCVSQRHAEFMCSAITLAGLSAASLTSNNTKDRIKLLERLKNGAINYLCVVDIFNEGVDIPTVDTVLFLRPTESLTIYLQQLGRGLRKAEGKDFVTILDFVGNARTEFNYAQRLRATIGPTTEDINTEVEHDFPHLPLGCQIQLEQKAKEYIVNNIRNFLNSYRIDRLLNNIRNFHYNYVADMTLKNFISFTKTPLNKIYGGKRSNGFKRCWTYLKYEASNKPIISTNMLDALATAVSNKWLSTDSATYFRFIQSLTEKHFCVDVNSLSGKEQKMVLMLYYDLFDKANEYSSLQSFINDCRRDDMFIEELSEVMSVLYDKTEALEIPRQLQCMSDFPLMVHGRYTKRQIQVAIETSTLQKTSSSREGVERNKALKVEAMYVDLIKDREEGSTTNYKDGALSPTVFTWETQNSVSPESAAGQAYIKKENTMLLFVREQAKGSEDKSRTEGFVFLGEVELDGFSGSKPMQITWKLKDPMPSNLWVTAHKLVSNF